MSLIHGRPFRHVTIERGEDSLGHVLYRAFSDRFDPELDVSSRTNRTIEAAVDCALAGHAAEALLTGRNKWVGSTADRAHAIDMASYRCGSAQQVEAYIEWRRTVVVDSLRLSSRWDAVKVLAEALLERKRLTHKEARRIYLEVVAPPCPLLVPDATAVQASLVSISKADDAAPAGGA
ncbi:MAG TPA: hypothetical protein VH062_00330 [Polyangiaceae bacterium]|nr:hypothetical protein [Polyangiaceae bacterium]